MAGADSTNLLTVTYALVSYGGAIINTNGHNITISQELDSAIIGGVDGGLTKLGAGMLTLSGTSSYNGGTTVNGGTLQLGSTGALGLGGVAISAGVLDLNNNSISIPTLTGTAGTITDNSGAPASRR